MKRYRIFSYRLSAFNLSITPGRLPLGDVQHYQPLNLQIIIFKPQAAVHSA
jgi:hypothetical protein